jgi:transcriptional regulator of arginine metabolism
MTASTAQRRRIIQEILTDHEISSQAELRKHLKRKGFRASQPVLSRDLRALGVAKQGGNYQLASGERVTPLTTLQALLRGVSPVRELVIVHCEPGAASAVARALEAEELEGLVGTVAGDDTILVATGSAVSAREVRRRVEGLLDLSRSQEGE